MPRIPLQGPPLAPADFSGHQQVIANALPAWLLDTPLARIKQLKTARPGLAPWQRDAAPADQQRLQQALQMAWKTQNGVDNALSNLQDVHAFAKPLLQQALKSRFGIEDDVEQTWVRLYAPVKTSWWAHDFAGATHSRTVSLLDAALHNFAAGETFSADSEFITRPDANGRFTVKPLKRRITIEQFKALCRELDLGARYQQHLKAFLLPDDGVARQALRHKVSLSQKHALDLAARMALMKKDIDPHAYRIVQGMLDDRRQLKWKGQTVSYYNLAMMDTTLTGIILIAPDVFSAQATVPVIAYVPHDPEHPLKQYPSTLALMAELTRQLRDRSTPSGYQKFFSQFVDQRQRGSFFARLNERLETVRWQPAAPGSNLPSWRETAVDNPNLQFSLVKFQDDRENRFNGDLWGYLYRCKLNKILNDAAELAIATAYADRMARWAWWDNLQKMFSDILDVALLVATPFVPFLGELMLAYTSYQLLDGVFEGVVDLAEGHLAEAGEQAIGVLESIVQLGAFAAGTTLGHVARVKLSSFVAGMKPVQLADGKTRLWNPDLAPYRLPETTLAPHVRPDAQGLHALDGKQLLRLDHGLFEVTKEPTGEHRIRHPSRPQAYAPTLEHNGRGAWVCETENPRQWEGTLLMRRLGHRTDGFSSAQLEHMRLLTGTDDNTLRRMHVENAEPPPLLADTLQRLGMAGPDAPVAPLSPAASQALVDCPQLIPVLAERVVAQATPLELQQITAHRRLPLRLRTSAREVQFELQSVRAAQGLQHEALSNLDSERLILGALRHYSDSFGALRVEIREATFDGELRCAAGAESATRLRVLVRVATDRYLLRDAADQPLHAESGLYETVLQAITHEGRNALGYQTHEVEPFKQWILAKTQAPSERRTVLATPPIRPAAEPNMLFLLRGGGLSKDGTTLQERIEDLHPHFSADEVDAFANALTEQGAPLTAIEAHENDLRELRNIVHRWRFQQPEHWGPASQSFRDDGGLHIYERLLECFERKNTDLGNRADPSVYALDLSRQLLSVDLEVWWAKRPVLKKFLDKVSVLKLDNTRFSSEATGLLKDFPNLVELSAQYCELTRLPERIGTTLRRLERLRLSNNHIVLDTTAVERLRSLTYLEVLKMDDNPLGLSPDLSRMPRLKVVALKYTGLTEWPQGTLAKPRPRGFLLDLRGNPLSAIPEVPTGSEAQWLVARTRLDVGALSELDQLRYQAHRRAMSLPPEPVLFSDPLRVNSIISSFGADYWGDVPGWGVNRETPWSELVDEPAAQPFMQTLLSVRDFADYRAGGTAREQLMQRVWRMLDAVHVDSRLREKLFTMVVAPVDCADAGAQLFNNMGINVLAYEAHAYSIEPKELERKLVTLAKGAARLEHVNEIARADVASRGGAPDDVEVYLAYQTGLAKRLGLPWQSEDMLYRPVSGVTDAMIDQAYETVLALGEGDGLIDAMLEQSFWAQYLSDKYPVRLERNKRLYQARYEQLETLRETQLKWTQARVDAERSALREQLNTLINDLPVPPTVVFDDAPISDAIFERLLVDLGDEEKALTRRLTREALTRAGL
ncbi:dermonecrotic toxin domain-containing protein [Pseudomonas sp. NPDC087803]|uniref:dermonecrotic toxin domain-containing protein n=1 Tax=Pseudomonas sp. NPDC087803 TaxID=3364448 RepID=UPI003814475E